MRIRLISPAATFARALKRALAAAGPRALTVAALAAALAICARPTRAAEAATAPPANRALIVGVNLYPGLKDETGVTPNLEGCVADANSVAATLKNLGFEVQQLADAKASRAAIMAAFKAMPACDRFVFYFAGHGDRSTARGAILLPGDALESSERNDITAQELNQWIKAVPARQRSVILDSCFSGGMMRSARIGGHRPLHTRFHHRAVTRMQAAAGRGIPDAALAPAATSADTNAALTVTAGPTAAAASGTSGSVCYFAATRENEQAGEYDFQGTRHGVFTFFLTRALNNSSVRWGDLQSKVTGDVSNQTEDEQHPTLSPAYVDTVVFEDPKPLVAPGPAATAPANPGAVTTTATAPADAVPTKSTLWDDYNRDRVDASQLFLTMNPNLTSIAVGQPVEFSATVAGRGFLIILEKGTSGNINLLYPADVTTATAAVSPGVARRIPADGFSYAPDAAGTERIRAILLSSEDAAQKLLNSFAKSRSVSRGLWARDLVEVPTIAAPAYTSDFTFEVVPKSGP